MKICWICTGVSQNFRQAQSKPISGGSIVGTERKIKSWKWPEMDKTTTTKPNANLHLML
jgi:hypothetical protein